jgi:cysteine synthase
MLPSGSRTAIAVLAATLGLLVALGGCQSRPTKLLVYQNERFELNEAYSRLFDAPADATCEAARRALLSQGYLVAGGSSAATLQARKHFQPEGDVHAQIEFHVFCVADGAVTTAFVSAIQERYVLKRNPNSASVGVNAIGSVSIPLGSSEDSLVKVGSETIPAGDFYDRFFSLMDRFLRETQAP